MYCTCTLSVAIHVRVCQLVVFVPGKDTMREANELQRCCLWKGADSLSKHKSYGHCPLAEHYHDNTNAIVIEELFFCV